MAIYDTCRGSYDLKDFEKLILRRRTNFKRDFQFGEDTSSNTENNEVEAFYYHGTFTRLLM